MKPRRYCWRVGGPVEVEDHEVCPECGSRTVAKFHHLYEDQNCCGKWVMVNKDPTWGQTCCLSMNHDGDCEVPKTVLQKLGAT